MKKDIKNRKKTAGRPHKGQKPQKPLQKPQKVLKAQLYGVHAVTEAWRNPQRSVHALYITEKALENFDLGAPTQRPNPTIVQKDELDKAFPQGAVHQGIALNCAPLPEIGVDDLIRHAGDNATILILDQVTDPHNVGAIIRSAAAFGATGIIMQRKHAPELSGVLAKTACGGVEHIAVAYETNLSRTIETLQEGGFFVYGLDERGERTIGEIKKGGKNALVLGAEGDGLRRLVAEHCDELIKLPTQPPIASLNVSNAAAIALYAFS